MPSDFSGRNLRGRNFKGQDLSGADFSNSDIRGANFTNAFLRGANFTGARAGLQLRWLTILTIISLVLAGISAISLGLASNLVFYLFIPSIVGDITIIPGLIALAILIVFLFSIYRQQEFGVVLVSTIITIAFVGIVTGIFTGAATASVSFTIAGILIFAIAGIVAVTASIAMTIAVAGKITGFIAIFITVMVSTTTAVGATAVVAATAVGASAFGIFLVVVLALVSCYMGWYALTQDKKYTFIRAIAIGWAAIGGTSFRNADLTYANFTQATLKSSDFRNARLNSTNWQAAKELDQARVGNSVLSNPAIRALLVTKNGYKQSYIGASLHGVNLQDANLVEANLKRADLSGAVLQNANLSGANLTEVLATGADFTRAMLTGACIQNWNIDRTTKLEDIDCQFVFLLEKPNESGSYERCPSNIDTPFNNGEFTKLFEEALSTVDLIFREGLDWKAFAEAFREIQGIERRGDDLLITVSVTSEVDKSEIDRQFLENYQLALQAIEAKYRTELQAKDREAEIYQKESKELRGILESLASRPIVIDSEQQDAEK